MSKASYYRLKKLQESINNCNSNNVLHRQTASLTTLDLTNFFNPDVAVLYQAEVEANHAAYRAAMPPPKKKRGRPKKEPKGHAWVEGKKKVYRKGYKPKSFSGFSDVSVGSFTLDPDMLGGLKLCNTCFIPKPLKSFRTVAKSRKRKDGSVHTAHYLNGSCRACDVRKTSDWKVDPANVEKVEAMKKNQPKYYKKWAAKNKGKIKGYSKKRYAKDKERLLLKAKKYYEENKEKLSLYGKKYYADNKEKSILGAQKYYAKNKEKVLAKAKQKYQDKLKVKTL